MDTATASNDEVIEGRFSAEDGQIDYFGADETKTLTLPDGKSWVEIKVLNEGERRKYLNKVNRDLKLDRQSGNASISMAPGDERYALLSAALIDWNLVRGGKPIPFTKSNRDTFLDEAQPKIIDFIEKEVRKANPWLLSDMTIEEIDREISALEEMREVKRKEDEGKDD